MGDTPLGTIETLLESVLEESDDPETCFKLRTSLQLLTVIRARENVARKALADCEMDEELRQRLQELGYLDQVAV